MWFAGWLVGIALWLGGQAPPLEAPSGFRARGLSSDEVLLWWRDDGRGAASLQLEIAADGQPWKQLAELPASAIVYSATGLAPAGRWRFRLGAVAAGGTIAWTEPVEASTFSPLHQGRHWYVRPSGDDRAAGTRQTPFRTLSRAVAAVEPGDTVWIGAGLYRESIVARGGREDAWVSYRNIPGEQPVLDGEASLANGIQVHKAGYVEISGLAARNFRFNGISCRETGPVIIRRCELYRNGSAGLALNFSAFTAQLLVEDNITYENGWGYGWASGIHLNNKLQGENVVHVIRRNLSYNNFDGSDHHTDGNGLMFDLGGTGSFCLIESNVCYNNGGRGINVLDGAAYVLHNTAYRNGWDASFEWAAAELAIANHYRNEAGLSIVRNNVLWARPKVRGHGGVIHLVRGARPSFSGNLVWSDRPEEAMALPEGAAAFAAPLEFVSVRKDNEFTEIHGRLFLKMDPRHYDLRLQRLPAGAPRLLDTGLRLGFGSLPRNPSAPGAGAWPLPERRSIAPAF